MTKKNQTAYKHRRLTDINGNQVKGIGIIAFVDKTNGIKEKKIIKDISYNQLIEVANDAIAFKFVPYYSYIIINKERYLMKTYRDFGAIIRKTKWKCVGPCITERDCPSTICLCIEGECD